MQGCSVKNYNTYLLTIFLGFMVLTIGIASFAYYKFKTLEEHMTRVRHTTNVIDEAGNSLSIIREVESGQRGYLLTRDPAFLPAFFDAQREQRIAFNTLQRLVADDPAQKARLVRLNALVTRRISLMERTLFLRQLDPQAAVVDSMRLGRLYTDSIRAGFEELINEERSQMAEREREQINAINNVPILTLLLSALALVILVLGYVFARRQHAVELLYRDELRRNNLRLSQQNQELEQFAYIASHDLQEPMRKVQTLADRILYKHREELNPDVLDALERIRLSSDRMRMLVQDVLQYSRIRHDDTPAAPVDLGAALRDALELLDETIRDKNATVSASPLPVVYGMHAQWVQVFLNLLSNAFKFAKDDQPPHVSITVEKLQPTRHANGDVTGTALYKISVSDNGIGFEERYAEKVFQVFKRLHAADRYPGTGIGLALVNKIVQVHQGTVEAHSAPNKGTTIIIYLPAIEAINGAPQPVPHSMLEHAEESKRHGGG